MESVNHRLSICLGFCLGISHINIVSIQPAGYDSGPTGRGVNRKRSTKGCPVPTDRPNWGGGRNKGSLSGFPHKKYASPVFHSFLSNFPASTPFFFTFSQFFLFSMPEYFFLICTSSLQRINSRPHRGMTSQDG